MTIRKALEKKRRVGFVLAVLCLFLFVGARFTGSHSKGLSPLILIFFIGYMVCVIFQLFGLRCPKCKNNLGGTLRSSLTIKLCPFCGVSLDEEIKQ